MGIAARIRHTLEHDEDRAAAWLVWGSAGLTAVCGIAAILAVMFI